MKHMNKKVVKRIFIGVGLYAVFVMAVIMLYPDTPHNMDWEDRQEFNKVQISKLELGQQKKHILELLGSPDITEAKRNDNKELQVMFYRTQHRKADGITTEDECTALLFENDELIAWGDSAYQSFVDG
jgi:outer membrane protein assembly factor BamE (lipoprotein component of BamABCDE complex)|tara:strand:+ start:830 stop:1213 length:384 start_codon:yes stop_codon:yes gene_type:complete